MKEDRNLKLQEINSRFMYLVFFIVVSVVLVFVVFKFVFFVFNVIVVNDIVVDDIVVNDIVVVDTIVVDIVISCCCCEKFKTSEARSGVGRVVRCSIYYPAVPAARMTERCATKLSVSTPVPLSDLLHLTPMRMKPGNCRSEESFSEKGHLYILKLH